MPTVHEAIAFACDVLDPNPDPPPRLRNADSKKKLRVTKKSRRVKMLAHQSKHCINLQACNSKSSSLQKCIRMTIFIR